MHEENFLQQLVEGGCGRQSRRNGDSVDREAQRRMVQKWEEGGRRKRTGWVAVVCKLACHEPHFGMDFGARGGGSVGGMRVSIGVR